MRRPLLAAALLALGPALAAAQSVALSGTLGGKALLVVDGGKPRVLAVGEQHQGVRLLSLAGDDAVVEIGGQRQTLRVGGVPVDFGPASSGGGGGSRIVLPAGAGGHFTGIGQINGKSVRFMVDTGATGVAIGMAQAQGLGLANRPDASLVRLNTANGVVIGQRLRLDSVRIGEVEVGGIDAVITPADMPYVLLGNSFLSRFSMRRDADLLVLDKRF